jgi:HEAT repeat protein
MSTRGSEGGSWKRSCPLVLLAAWLAVSCGGSESEYRISTDTGAAIRALGSDDLEVSEPALERLVAFGGDALPALQVALRREPSAVRRGIVEALGRIDDPAAVGILSGVAASDPDADVRYEAITMLGARGGSGASAEVEAALADPLPRIRLAAAGACPALCTSTEAIDRLVGIAIEDQPLANGVAARTALVRMLATHETERAERIRVVVRGRVPPALARHGSEEEAVRAALLASDVGDAAGREVLARVARGAGPPILRLQAIDALGRVGDSDDVAVLAGIDGESTFGDYAYDALRRLAERSVPGAPAALEGWRSARPAVALLPPPGAR